MWSVIPRLAHRHPRVRETRELVLGGRAVLGTLARTWVAIAHQNVSSLLGRVRLPALREDVEHLLQVLGADGTVPQPDEGIEHLLLLPVARLLGVERMQQMTKLGEREHSVAVGVKLAEECMHLIIGAARHTLCERRRQSEAIRGHQRSLGVSTLSVRLL